MQKHNSLAHYARVEFLKRSLIYLSGRLKRPSPLIEAYSHCKEQHPSLQEDLKKFYLEVMKFCGEWKQLYLTINRPD
jgi:acyl carrier protein phosphodiesterase